MKIAPSNPRAEKRRAAGILALLLALLLPGVTLGEASLKTAVVERLHDELLGVMKGADALGYTGRYEKLSPVVSEIFDTRFMAEKSVGRFWKKMSDVERERFLSTVGRYTVANYAGRFDGYTGQSFETVREEDSLAGTVLVHTKLNDPGNEDIQLNYRLRLVDGSWKIIDVYLNGTVSELALRRSEYSALIKRKGVEALISALDDKITALQEGRAEDS